MRVRLGVEALLPGDLRAVVSFQDVVLWGGDGGAAGGADPEVHQGFLEMRGLPGGTTLRAGRQEIALGNQRLVSNNNWGQRGRRFDGLRVSGGGAGWSWDALALRLEDGGPSGPRNAWFNGVHARLPLAAEGRLHLFALHDRARTPERTDRFTLGGEGEVAVAAVTLLAEGYLQGGSRGDTPIRAAMVSLGGRIPTPGPSLELRWDRYSGDGEPGDGEFRAFDRLYGSNHAFHGYLDLFTRIPAGTEGRGLVDLQLRARGVKGGGWEMEAALHAFRTTARPEGDISGRLGREVDLVLRHRLRTLLALEGGGGWFRPGPAFGALRGVEKDVGFLYLMATLTF